ncbi:unnamed protein product [Pedinophyceae sp. YPF-701]|nr:unnamed protein product [Pedinophyceae sp. YPF-701]
MPPKKPGGPGRGSALGRTGAGRGSKPPAAGRAKDASGKAVPSYMRGTAAAKAKENDEKFDYQDIRDSAAAQALRAALKLKQMAGKATREQRLALVQSLTADNIRALGKDVIRQLQVQDIALFTKEQLGAMSDEQLGALSATHVASLSEEQLGVFNQRQIARLPPALQQRVAEIRKQSAAGQLGPHKGAADNIWALTAAQLCDLPADAAAQLFLIDTRAEPGAGGDGGIRPIQGLGAPTAGPGTVTVEALLESAIARVGAGDKRCGELQKLLNGLRTGKVTKDKVEARMKELLMEGEMREIYAAAHTVQLAQAALLGLEKGDPRRKKLEGILTQFQAGGLTRVEVAQALMQDFKPADLKVALDRAAAMATLDALAAAAPSGVGKAGMSAAQRKQVEALAQEARKGGMSAQAIEKRLAAIFKGDDKVLGKLKAAALATRPEGVVTPAGASSAMAVVMVPDTDGGAGEEDDRMDVLFGKMAQMASMGRRDSGLSGPLCGHVVNARAVPAAQGAQQSFDILKKLLADPGGDASPAERKAAVAAASQQYLEVAEKAAREVIAKCGNDPAAVAAANAVLKQIAAARQTGSLPNLERVQNKLAALQGVPAAGKVLAKMTVSVGTIVAAPADDIEERIGAEPVTAQNVERTVWNELDSLQDRLAGVDIDEVDDSDLLRAMGDLMRDPKHVRRLSDASIADSVGSDTTAPAAAHSPGGRSGHGGRGARRTDAKRISADTVSEVEDETSPKAKPQAKRKPRRTASKAAAAVEEGAQATRAAARAALKKRASSGALQVHDEDIPAAAGAGRVATLQAMKSQGALHVAEEEVPVARAGLLREPSIDVEEVADEEF